LTNEQAESGLPAVANQDEEIREPVSRFDIAMAGLRLILPEGVACEYFSQAIVYPVPRAPRRLLGMMHMRGQAVPVFDTQAESTDLLPIVQRCQLIVLRGSQQAVGLICDRPPRAVLPLEQLRDFPRPLPLLDAALVSAYQLSDEDGDAADEKSRIAWTLDLPRLIECCLADDYDTTAATARPQGDEARPQNL